MLLWNAKRQVPGVWRNVLYPTGRLSFSTGSKLKENGSWREYWTCVGWTSELPLAVSSAVSWYESYSSYVFFHSQLANVSILLLKGTLSSLEKLRQNQWVFYRLREWFLGEFIGESKILRRFLVPHYNAGAKFLGMIVFWVPSWNFCL